MGSTRENRLSQSVEFVILGGGIAGLTAGLELSRRGHSTILLEKSMTAGGLARTFESNGFRFDLGGHRFHSNNSHLVKWLREVLKNDLLTVERVSHIFLNGRFVQYPLQFSSLFQAYTAKKTFVMLAGYAKARWVERHRPDHSFEDWVVKRFGWPIYHHFFQPYTEKVWGIPCHQLSADWAAQRIGLPSLWKAARSLVRPPAGQTSTISQFYYPPTGFGAIPQAIQQAAQQHGCQIWLQTAVEQLQFRPDGLTLHTNDGRTIEAQQLISTIPLEQLLPLLPGRISPPDLSYRGLICLFIALKKKQVSQDSWTYFPGREFLFGRTHEPKNWSAAMVPDPSYTSLGIEIFSGRDDPLWQAEEEDIHNKVVAQLQAIGWLAPPEIVNRWLLRLPHAYPIYQLDYQKKLAQVKAQLAQWPRLHLVGRTGSFRYMNSDGVIEDVFRLLRQLEGIRPGNIPPLTVQNGRWV